MQKIKITNLRAGNSLKLPGGTRLLKGQTLTVAPSVMSNRHMKFLLRKGRIAMVVVETPIEEITESVTIAVQEAPPVPPTEVPVARTRKRIRRTKST